MDRLSYPFDNANVAGHVAGALLTIVVVGALSFYQRHHGIIGWLFKILHLCLGGLLSWYMLQTGSRAALLGFACGFCLVAHAHENITSRLRHIKLRHAGALLALGFVLSLITWHSPLAWRIQSLRLEHASVSHRLELWASALGMSTSRWSWNPDSYRLSAINEWLLPATMQGRYDGCLGVPLTFLVEYGWPWFILTMFGVVFVCVVACWCKPRLSTPTGCCAWMSVSVLMHLTVSGLFQPGKRSCGASAALREARNGAAIPSHSLYKECAVHLHHTCVSRPPFC